MKGSQRVEIVKKEAFRVVATISNYSGYPVHRHNLSYLAAKDEGGLNLVGGCGNNLCKY
jgi:hypothetical protein